MQVADLRGSLKAVAVAADWLYVGGQSCQVTAYRLSPELLAGAASLAEATASPDVWPTAGGGPGSAAASVAEACGGPSSETIRAMVGRAAAPDAASDPRHSHCGSITALVACGPYLFSASTDSTVRVWAAATLEHVKVLRGHRGSVLALYAGPGIVLSGGRDHLIRVWDVETLVCRRTLSGHTDDVLSLDGVSVGVSPPDLAQLTSPGSPSTAAMAAGLSPMGAPLPPAPGSPGAPGSPRSGLERALLFVSSGADGAVRLWSGGQGRGGGGVCVDA
jgi:hypothetical protein